MYKVRTVFCLYLQQRIKRGDVLYSVLCCRAKANGSFCSLVKEGDTAFCLCAAVLLTDKNVYDKSAFYAVLKHTIRVRFDQLTCVGPYMISQFVTEIDFLLINAGFQR